MQMKTCKVVTSFLNGPGMVCRHGPSFLACAVFPFPRGTPGIKCDLHRECRGEGLDSSWWKCPLKRDYILACKGLPRWSSGKESTCQCRRLRFSPWVGKIPWRRKWQPTPVVLPGESRGLRSWAGYSPWDCKELDRTEHTHRVIFWSEFLFKIKMAIKLFCA